MSAFFIAALAAVARLGDEFGFHLRCRGLVISADQDPDAFNTALLTALGKL